MVGIKDTEVIFSKKKKKKKKDTEVIILLNLIDFLMVIELPPLASFRVLVEKYGKLVAVMSDINKRNSYMPLRKKLCSIPFTPPYISFVVIVSLTFIVFLMQ